MIESPSPVCYLAHPIDLRDDFEPINADYVRGLLREAGFVVYSPARAFQTPSDAGLSPKVHRVNQVAVNQADALVALYPEDKGIGTAMELQQAVSREIPVLVITRAAERSWVLTGLAESERVRVVRYPGKGEHFQWLRGAVDQWPKVRQVLPLPFQVQDGAQLPTIAYPGDAGFDLYALGQHLIEPGEFVDVPCGCSVQLPAGVWGFLIGRSSTLRKHELLVNPGIIDTGYRGSLYAGVRNMGPEVFEVKHGMRLAQLIPLPNLASGPEIDLAPTSVRRLDESARGVAGFGSSGE